MLRDELIKLRQQAGLSVREAARDLGKSAGYLSRIEGRGEIPTPTLLCEMANLYGADPEPLLKSAAKEQIETTERQINERQNEALRLFRRSRGDK